MYTRYVNNKWLKIKRTNIFFNYLVDEIFGKTIEFVFVDQFNICWPAITEFSILSANTSLSRMQIVYTIKQIKPTSNSIELYYKLSMKTNLRRHEEKQVNLVKFFIIPRIGEIVPNLKRFVKRQSTDFIYLKRSCRNVIFKYSEYIMFLAFHKSCDGFEINELILHDRWWNLEHFRFQSFWKTTPTKIHLFEI